MLYGIPYKSENIAISHSPLNGCFGSPGDIIANFQWFSPVLLLSARSGQYTIIYFGQKLLHEIMSYKHNIIGAFIYGLGSAVCSFTIVQINHGLLKYTEGPLVFYLATLIGMIVGWYIPHIYVVISKFNHQIVLVALTILLAPIIVLFLSAMLWASYKIIFDSQMVYTVYEKIESAIYGGAITSYVGFVIYWKVILTTGIASGIVYLVYYIHASKRTHS